MPGLTIGDTIPDLLVHSTHGPIQIHDFIGDGWAVIFSHPADFTPVCTTELGKIALYAEEFDKREVKLLGVSCDDIASHVEWIKDIEAYTMAIECYTILQCKRHIIADPFSTRIVQNVDEDLNVTRMFLKPGCNVRYPIVADPDREVIRQLNMVDPDQKDSSGLELPSRALHVIGPDKRIKLSILYPATTGRNMDEVVRVVESLQKASKLKIATPVNWKPGEKVVISPSVSNEEAKKMFQQGYDTVDLPSKKEYLRFTNI